MGGYVVLVGGDYVHARLLMPALFAILAPFLVVAASSRYLEAILITATWALFCGIALRADEQPGSFTLGHFGRNLTTEDRGFVQRGLGQDWIDGPGLYLGSTFTADGIATGIALADHEDVVVATHRDRRDGLCTRPRAGGCAWTCMGLPTRSRLISDLSSVRFPATRSSRQLPGSWPSSPTSPAPCCPRKLPIEHGLWPELEPLEFLDQVAWAQATLSCSTRTTALQEASTEPLTPAEFCDQAPGRSPSQHEDPAPPGSARGLR